MDENVKAERKKLLILSAILSLAIPLLMVFLILRAGQGGGWPGVAAVVSGYAGIGVMLFAARHWRYQSCIVFLLPNLADGLLILLLLSHYFAKMPNEVPQLAAFAAVRYLWVGASPFLFLAIWRGFAGVKNESLFVLLSLLAVFGCEIVFRILAASAFPASAAVRSYYGLSAPASASDLLAPLLNCAKAAAAYALLRFFSRAKVARVQSAPMAG